MNWLKLKMLWLRNKKTVVTHSQNFHADDVFSVAVMTIYFEGNIKLIRSRDKEIYSKADYVLDVGGEYDAIRKRFDHHQPGGAGKRGNGIPYSSLGLVWKDVGEKVSGSKEIAEIIDRKLVQVIDADDNGFPITSDLIAGVEPYSISDYIVYSNSVCEPENRDKAFKKMVAFAKEIIETEIKIANYALTGRKIVQAAYASAPDKRLIILDEDCSRPEILSDYPEPLFVVKFSETANAWKLYTVRVKGEKFKNRLDLPVSWSGKKDGDLVKVTGVSDALYCHHNLYMAMAGSKEGAVALAKLALKQDKN